MTTSHQPCIGEQTAEDNKCPGCAHSYTSKKGLKAHVDNNRCKGKSPALVAHEATQEVQRLSVIQAINVADLQGALQAVQTERDVLKVITDLQNTQTVLENFDGALADQAKSQHFPAEAQSGQRIDDNGRLLLQTLVGTDFVKSQVYFGIPGIVPTLQAADGTAIDITSMQSFQVLKVGYKEQEEHDRFGDHSREMGGYQVLDSILTRFPLSLERQLLRYLRSEKLLVRAKFPKKSGLDRECALIRSHKEYADMVAFAKEMAANMEKPGNSTDEVLRTELELIRGQIASKEAETRLAEAEARKSEAEARKSEAEARKLEAQARIVEAEQLGTQAAELTCQKELDYETLTFKYMMSEQQKNQKQCFECNKL